MTVMISASTRPGSAMNRSMSAASATSITAAQRSGDQSDRHADEHRDQCGAEADRQRGLRPVDHPAEHVAAQIVGAEPMRRARQGEHVDA